MEGSPKTHAEDRDAPFLLARLDFGALNRLGRAEDTLLVSQYEMLVFPDM